MLVGHIDPYPMKSSWLNRNSQIIPTGMGWNPCQLIQLKVPLVIAGKACCPGAHWNDGTTGVISWAKGGRAMVDEAGRVGNVLGFHCFFFRRETKPWNLCRMFVTDFFFGKDGDFCETTSICLVWECFMVGLPWMFRTWKNHGPGWPDEGKPDRGEATFPLW